MINKGSFYEASLYGTGKLTAAQFSKASKLLSAAFPKLKDRFFVVLGMRVKDKQFTYKRLLDSINHVIDTCEYPEPTIANFLSFDKKIELYTYHQVVALNSEEYHGQAFAHFKRIKHEYGDNIALYASVKDIEMLNLTLYTHDNNNKK